MPPDPTTNLVFSTVTNNQFSKEKYISSMLVLCNLNGNEWPSRIIFGTASGSLSVNYNVSIYIDCPYCAQYVHCISSHTALPTKTEYLTRQLYYSCRLEYGSQQQNFCIKRILSSTCGFLLVVNFDKDAMKDVPLTKFCCSKNGSDT